MECREVRGYLPADLVEVGEPALMGSAEVEEHLRSCGPCRVELAEFRELGDLLRGLADEPIEPPGWLLDTLVESVTRRASRVAAMKAGRERLADPKVAAAGAAILLAGLTGALLVRGRRRARRSLSRRVREALAHA